MSLLSLVIKYLCQFGFPLLCITYSQLLSYYVDFVWAVENPLGQYKCRLRLSIDQLSSNCENNTIETSQ